MIQSRLVVGLGFLALALPGRAVVMIDSFTSGPYTLNVSAANPSAKAVGAGLPGVLGGHRDVLLQYVEGPSTISSNVNPAHGMLFFSAFAMTRGTLTLQYDGDDNEPPTGPLNPGSNLGANFSGLDRFELRFPEVQTILVRTTVASATGTSTVESMVPTGVNVALEVPFASFAGVDFSQVHRLEFELVSNNATDFALDSIAAVPEPGTIAALALGAGALAARRRRRA
jgi:hypothetical protein